LNIVVSHLAVAVGYLRINLKTLLEYRVSFFIQIVSMFFNDFIWIIFWFFFFENFNNVNGYVFADMAIMYGLLATAYGLAGVFSDNRNKLADMIAKGKLDYYLTLPKNVLFHIMTSGFSSFALGDLLFGSVILVLFAGNYPILLMLLFLLTGIIILIAMGIIVSSLAFFFGNSERLSYTLRLSTVSFAQYPIGIFGGFAKIILLTVFPVGFIAAMPLETLKNFSFGMVFLIVGVAFLVLLISVVIFYIGLRRYESGNLLYVRT